MISAQAANSSGVTTLLVPADKADTTAATGDWTAVDAKAGYLVITQHVGVVTAGSIAGKIEAADDDQGTNAADVATFTSVTTSTDNPNAQRVVLPATVGAYIRYVGTITTGPAVVGVTMLSSAAAV